MSSNDRPRPIVIKYGGNAIVDVELTRKILNRIVKLQNEGYKIVIVHGGGPFIKQNLELAGIKSEFIGGQRKTDSKAMKYIEMSLKGEVNGKIVREINLLGAKAVGLSGKDGQLAIAKRRYHYDENNRQVDLGQVGDVEKINTEIIELLLDNNYIPVIATIAAGSDGNDYNINADNFAGFVAAALNADELILMTDVDGLMMNPDDDATIITELKTNEIEDLIGKVIKGGMLPKTEACKYAVDNGAERSIIINGTKPDLIEAAIKKQDFLGTIITK
ncbi:MAG: acetylglutamate kinase [Melioribacteraceae bacterium]|nr:acetylglutamate kinase [Melioribacteraceae bacterium]